MSHPFPPPPRRRRPLKWRLVAAAAYVLSSLVALTFIGWIVVCAMTIPLWAWVVIIIVCFSLAVF